jgi:hypothetical protein
MTLASADGRGRIVQSPFALLRIGAGNTGAAIEIHHWVELEQTLNQRGERGPEPRAELRGDRLRSVSARFGPLSPFRWMPYEHRERL